MSKPRIAFQGFPGSYSELACRDRYPDHEPFPCQTFEGAFAAVVRGQAALAMIPVENSVAGRVADIHVLLPETSLHIVGETFQRVRHELLGVAGARLEGLSTVHSHAHALAQCRKWIARRGLTPVVETDTAGAAKKIARRGDPGQAAIASSLAARIHGLAVLRRGIADDDRNTTRFLVMGPRAEEPPPGGAVITSLIFRVRNLPAALYKALGGFSTNGVNMLKLESYMLDGSFTATQFYCDIAGHPQDPGVRRAFEELDFFSSSFRILGAYPADPLRSSGDQSAPGR